MVSVDELGSEFIEKTKYMNMGPSPEGLGEPFPHYLMQADPKLAKIELPKPEEIALGDSDLRVTIENRRSVRRYANTVLSMEELSYLLWMTQGVKRISERSGMTLRTVPSAGARHPLETYLSINRVDGLTHGLYHFLADQHMLEAVRLGQEVNRELTSATLEQQQVATSAVTFIWVAEPYRTVWRYGSRGYRYLFLDAGHVCQNLHLAAEAIECGVCAIGAYYDDMVNALVGIDGKSQFAIYLASLGKKPKDQEV